VADSLGLRCRPVVVRVVALCAAGIAALLAPAFARAYGWPIKPFDQQHAIRGAFDDPRQGRGVGGLIENSFHFGVDISAADGTPVYAVAPGTVFLYPDSVTVHQPDGHKFAYWHIVGVVSEHGYVKAGDLIGYVRLGWGHVHLAEWNGKTYLNPLRPGGLEPFTDDTTPVVGDIDIKQQDGRLDATVEAYDLPPIQPPPPWQDARWTPAFVRWRLLRDGQEVLLWRIAADFRMNWIKGSNFDSIYAPGTTQNRPLDPGRYIFWLAHGLDVHSLPDGTYELQVRASDTRDNTASRSVTLTITNVQRRKTTYRVSRRPGAAPAARPSARARARGGRASRRGKAWERKARRLQEAQHVGGSRVGTVRLRVGDVRETPSPQSANHPPRDRVAAVRNRGARRRLFRAAASAEQKRFL
jgi:murein DD-endopeptidase MepM/ murein hydrolase activator NlpD